MPEQNCDLAITGQLQSNRLERQFFQYFQMRAGQFLVCLWEVLNSERISKYNSLLKVQINFWDKDLKK